MLQKFNLHTFFLNQIKVKTKASFVGYERYKDEYAIRIIKNKETTYYKLDGTPDDVTIQRYNELLTQIVDGNEI